MHDVEIPIIAKIEHKTTPFGFSVQLFESIHRNSYLATIHENKTFVLNIQQIWNDQHGMHAKLKVIGDIPLSPFPLDAKISLATPQEIIDVLGLEENPEKAINLGNILHTAIQATPNVEKLGRVFITGKSGSGKSYTVGVIIEELMKKQIPVVIIDRHGEYASLKILNKQTIPEEELFFNKNDPTLSYAQNIIEFGDPKVNPGVDLDLQYLIAAKLEDLIATGNCIILNLSGLEIPKQEILVNRFCYRLYKASVERRIPPHFLFIDEAHLFAGKKKSDIVETLKLSAQEGRKFGHNLVVITQKPQLLDTTIRAQAGTWIVHKLTDLNDIKITVNSAEGLGGDADDEIQNLAQGEAIITGDIAPSSPLRVQIRHRYTVHGGAGYNVLDFIQDGQSLPKAELVEKLRAQLKPEVLAEAGQSLMDDQKLSPSELFLRIENLRGENQTLMQQIADLKASLNIKQEELNGNTVIVSTPIPKPEPFPFPAPAQNNNPSDDFLANLPPTTTPTIPKPEEMYDEKMLETMEERDDLKIQLEETVITRDEKVLELQMLQLDVSGIQVENESLKSKLKKETQRADDAVALAERAVATMKKKRR